jgi:membrane protein implicated in regulation of membrane protease activity
VLRNVLAALTGAVLLVLGVMFSIVILVAIAIVALGVWGYLMWKTRKIRSAMQEQAQNHHGNVIEGEAVVVEEYSGPESKTLSERRTEE